MGDSLEKEIQSLTLPHNQYLKPKSPQFPTPLNSVMMLESTLPRVRFNHISLIQNLVVITHISVLSWESMCMYWRIQSCVLRNGIVDLKLGIHVYVLAHSGLRIA